MLRQGNEVREEDGRYQRLGRRTPDGRAYRRMSPVDLGADLVSQRIYCLSGCPPFLRRFRLRLIEGQAVADEPRWVGCVM